MEAVELTVDADEVLSVVEEVLLENTGGEVLPVFAVFLGCMARPEGLKHPTGLVRPYA